MGCGEEKRSMAKDHPKSQPASKTPQNQDDARGKGARGHVSKKWPWGNPELLRVGSKNKKKKTKN